MEGLGFALPLFFLAYSVVIIGVIVCWIFFLINLQATLQRVSRENRRMEPGLVWLNLIPVFGYGWFIYTVVRVAASLRAEFRSRGWPSVGNFGFGVGLAAGILNPVGMVWRFLPSSVYEFGTVLALGALVCWIVYWVRTVDYKNRLGRWSGWGGAMPPSYAAYPPPAGPGDGPAVKTEGAGAQRPVKYCVVCGTVALPEDKFCPVCGRLLP